MVHAGGLGACWLGLLAGACGGAPQGGLRLLEFRQQDLDSVALNEELLFYFSEDLERASVTSDSVRILDAAGAEVAGERVLRGNALSFLPDLPCASDLSDGGLRPGQGYRVILGGFPRPDGIRGESGALLSASLRLEFRTAEVGAKSPLFLDPFLGPFRLSPAGKRGRPMEFEDGRIVLEYGEALDPASVPGCRFELSPGARGLPPIPVTARLVENRRNRAVLVLEPDAPELGGRLPPDRYWLHMPGRELRTLGQREVELALPFLQLSVPELRMEFDFSTTRERSSDLPPGCDSTALWNEHGPGLRLRYPAAAGSGQAGSLVLVACPATSDLHAERLTVPADGIVDLSALAGPVVIRSQTTLEVRGRLTRRGAGSWGGRKDPLTEELERLARLTPVYQTNLSTWLAALLDPTQPWAKEPWTVLVAGGDIRVPSGGAIEVDGPLVLVAGGRIRVEGEVVAWADIWRTCECGGMFSRGGGKNRDLPLQLDEPATNPLRTAFRAGALTMEMPWTPRKGAWRQTITGLEGGGRMRARFLEPVPGATRPRVSSDPGEITAGSMRVLLQLELAPGQGEPWNPPRFERLRLEASPPASFERGGG